MKFSVLIASSSLLAIVAANQADRSYGASAHDKGGHAPSKKHGVHHSKAHIKSKAKKSDIDKYADAHKKEKGSKERKHSKGKGGHDKKGKYTENKKAGHEKTDYEKSDIVVSSALKTSFYGGMGILSLAFL